MTEIPESDAEIFKTPGQLVQHLLDKMGWTQRTLAIVLDADESGLNHVLAGRRPMKADLALAIGEVLRVDPAQLLEIQKTFELAQARLLARPDPGRATRAFLFGGLPVAEMIRRGWIAAESVRDTARVESELMRFFGAASLDEIEILPHAAKKTNVATGTTPAQLAWLYRVKLIAQEMLVGRFTPGAFANAIRKLDLLLSAPEEARKVPRILAEAGVRFVIVETLPSAKIDGVCFWLDDQSPVIGMTLRHDRIDNFWFVLRHECEHVAQGHGRSVIALDTEIETSASAAISDEEKVANEAAANFCVPKIQMDRFVARKSPFFSERDIIGFARTLGIHPGLVAGQLQNRTSRHNLFKRHQVKIRHHVTPGSMVDGWGDVAPIDA